MQNKKICILFLLITIISTFNIYVFADIPNVISEAAVVIDADTGIVLGGKDVTKKVYPASTTKILTAILALENLDLNKSVVVSKTAIAIPWDSSRIYLKEGEVLTVKDLLYGLLLESGNDAANVLAESVSGSIKEFVKLMNDKLKELGCNNTHFANAHGYSDNDHYTTALDMSKILKYCIKNDTFVEIFSSKSYIMEATNKTKEKRYFTNTNRLIQTKEDSIYSRYYKYCIGGKTGYTDEAGKTLVTYGKKDNKNIIVTVFNGGTEDGKDARYTDAINLFEFAFNNFEKQTIAKSNDYSFQYTNLESKLRYYISMDSNLDLMLKENNGVKEFSYTVNIDDTKLPKDTEDKTTNSVGTIKFNMLLDNEVYEFEKDLKVNNIEKLSILETSKKSISTIIVIVILTTILICIVIFLKGTKNKGKKRHTANTDFKYSRKRNRKR